MGAWRVEEAFHDLLWNPAFLIPASQILGGSVRFWHDQLFSKPAKHGGVVAWHQDYSYWTRTVPIAHLTCWLALDDSTVENGCLQYVPGSHRWNLLPITGLAGNMEEIMTVLSDEQKAAFRPVPIELKKGECAIHHSLLVHGSYENRSERSRRATVINVFRDGVQSAKDDEPLEGASHSGGTGHGRAVLSTALRCSPVGCGRAVEAQSVPARKVSPPCGRNRCKRVGAKGTWPLMEIPSLYQDRRLED
ncbi:MAG: phytanoyl-CoA dioxygenase family protein [Bryobacterales bacterium]|nr:phytanoyl-CoA dioxygenase family protein [Bryobacterales bacterium]